MTHLRSMLTSISPGKELQKWNGLEWFDESCRFSDIVTYVGTQNLVYFYLF